jgi:hypothetical protein
MSECNRDLSGGNTITILDVPALGASPDLGLVGRRGAVITARCRRQQPYTNRVNLDNTMSQNAELNSMVTQPK